jgi:hypothetical protein
VDEATLSIEIRDRPLPPQQLQQPAQAAAPPQQPQQQMQQMQQPQQPQLTQQPAQAALPTLPPQQLQMPPAPVLPPQQPASPEGALFAAKMRQEEERQRARQAQAAGGGPQAPHAPEQDAEPGTPEWFRLNAAWAKPNAELAEPGSPLWKKLQAEQARPQGTPAAQAGQATAQPPTGLAAQSALTQPAAVTDESAPITDVADNTRMLVELFRQEREERRQAEDMRRRAEEGRRRVDEVYRAQMERRESLELPPDQPKPAERPRLAGEGFGGTPDRPRPPQGVPQPQTLQQPELPRSDALDRAAALSAALAATASANAGKRQDEARRAVDPEYARDRDRNELQAALGRSQQAAALAGKAGAPGAGAAGNIAGGAMQGAAVGGPWGAAAGAAVASAGELNKAIVKTIENVGDFGTKLASADAGATARAFLDVGKVVPVVGEQLAAFGHATLNIHEALTAEARRLSGYSAQLATARAELDVRSLERDMTRADRFSPQLARQLELEDELNATMQEIRDKYMTQLTNAAVVGVRTVEGVARTVDGVLQASLQIAETVAIVAQHLAGMPPPLRQALELLRRLVSNSEPEDAAFRPLDFADQLRLTELPLDPGLQDRQQQLRQQQQNRPPLFPGL